MTDKLSISVITPSYQQGNFIETTIQSVLTQDIPHLEYLIVDGGSTDQTLTILQKYYPAVQWLSEKDQGQADAVNKGLAKTKGEIIGWLNSDDIYYPDTLKKVHDFFVAHPEVDILYGGAHEIDSEGNLLRPYATKAWDIERLKVECFLSQPATFFRRRVVEQHGALNTQLYFCLDYEYWLRLGLNKANFAYLPQVLSGSRIHPETKSSRGYLAAHFEAINMLQQKLGYIPSDWVVNYSSAKVKTEKQLNFPQPRFVIAVWLTLWETAGIHNKGFARLMVWFEAQVTLVKKIIYKLVPAVN